MGLENAVVEQETKVIVQQLDMLERFKESIVATEGEDAYHERVAALLAELCKKKRRDGAISDESSDDDEGVVGI